MRRKWSLWIACAALAMPASAEIVEVAPERYVCDAAAGQTHGADVSHVFAGSWMAARIRFLEARPGSAWATAAGLMFHLDSGEAAAVLLIAPADRPDELWVSLKPPGSGEPTGMAILRRGRAAEISATMRRGAVFVRVGNERGQIYVGDARLVRREVACFSGRFEIDLVRHPTRARPY